MLVFLLLISFFGVKNDSGVCKESLENLVSKNPYVFEAEVSKVYESPNEWSGSFIFNWQKVKYKINKVVKGNTETKEIIVSHALIEGSPLTDKDKPQLSPTYFYLGRKLILFVDKIDSNNKSSKKNEGEFIETDSYCSALPYDKENFLLF